MGGGESKMEKETGDQFFALLPDDVVRRIAQHLYPDEPVCPNPMSCLRVLPVLHKATRALAHAGNPNAQLALALASPVPTLRALMLRRAKRHPCLLTASSITYKSEDLDYTDLALNDNLPRCRTARFTVFHLRHVGSVRSIEDPFVEESLLTPHEHLHTIRLLAPLAHNRFLPAQHDLALYLLDRVEPANAAAIPLLRDAASHGHPGACAAYADCLFFGRAGMGHDWDAAIAMYNAVAGSHQHTRRRTPALAPEAREKVWKEFPHRCRRASSETSGEAVRFVHEVPGKDGGMGVGEKGKGGVAWALSRFRKRALEDDDKSACVHMAYCLLFAVGLEVSDEVEAREWYDRGVGYAASCH